jgi:Flp pilus assembly protein CpaB
MKLKSVLLLVLAVILGTAAGRLCQRLLSGTPAPQEELVVVLVAKQPLAADTVLRDPDRLFEERTLNKSEAPSQVVSRLPQLRGRRLAKALEAQALVTTDCLADEEGPGADQLKREGRQAVVVQVKSLGGTLFWPESRVDVIWTANAGRSESRVIARDLPLLGLQAGRNGKIIATVAAKREDTNKLTQAARQGTLRLIRRQSPQEH